MTGIVLSYCVIALSLAYLGYLLNQFFNNEIPPTIVISADPEVYATYTYNTTPFRIQYKNSLANFEWEKYF